MARDDWFDGRYAGREERITLCDSIWLIADFCKRNKIKIPPDEAENFERSLKQVLHDFNQRYQPSLRVIGYHLLFNVAASGRVGRDDCVKYAKRYERILTKYEGKIMERDEFD